MVCFCSICNRHGSADFDVIKRHQVSSQPYLLFQTKHSLFLLTGCQLPIVHTVLLYLLLFFLFKGFVFVIINGRCYGLMPFDDLEISGAAAVTDRTTTKPIAIQWPMEW